MANEELEGWPEYRKLVLAELSRISFQQQALDLKLTQYHADHGDDLSGIKTEIAILKAKSAVIAAVVSIIIGPIVAAIVAALMAKSRTG